MKGLSPDDDSLLGTAAWLWRSAKQLFEYSIAFSPDAIHVLIGVCLQLAVALLARQSVARWVPWLVVLALTLLNEAADLSARQFVLKPRHYGESVKDLLLTMALPTLLMIAVRRRPGLFSRS